METAEIWFENRGTRLFAVEQGQGEVLVLLHGGLANHAACAGYASALASSFRVITPDLRANGRSRDGGAITWDLLAEDVAALVTHLGVPRAIIGGISMGSGVAIATALRHPAIVSRLVLLHPVYAGAERGLSPPQAAAMIAMHAFGSRAVAEGVGVMLPLFEHAPPAIRERAAALVASYDAPSVATITAFMASGAQPFARAEDLATITVPALVAPGLDPQHPPEVAELYRQHLPRCTVVSGDPAGFATAIAAFARA